MNALEIAGKSKISSKLKRPNGNCGNEKYNNKLKIQWRLNSRMSTTKEKFSKPEDRIS